MEISCNDISKCYDTVCVLEHFHYTFGENSKTAIMGLSGIGKTTLLNILMGLVKPDRGEVIFSHEGKIAEPVRYSAVFQENRLCEDFTPVGNMMAVSDRLYGNGDDCGLFGKAMTGKGKTVAQKKELIRSALLKLLPEDCLHKRVCTLSGGMKRRLAIVRAMECSSEVVILDEPFTGLDIETKRKCAAYILERLRQRLLIVVTHDEAEAALLGCSILLLTK